MMDRSAWRRCVAFSLLLLIWTAVGWLGRW